MRSYLMVSTRHPVSSAPVQTTLKASNRVWDIRDDVGESCLRLT